MPGSNSLRKTCQVDLEPIGRRVQVSAGTTLLQAAQSAGVELVAICGGTGSCSTCRLKVVSGEISPRNLTEEAELSFEELAAGYRLACQAEVLGDVRVDIPPESLTTPQRLQVEGQGVEVGVDSLVYPVEVQLDPPDLYDLRSDFTRLNTALEKIGEKPPQVDLAVLADLPNRLRDQSWSARLAIRKSDGEQATQLVGVLPSGSQLLGLAVDIGTTKLAAYLVELETGHVSAKGGAMNPQIGFGEDVISRISYTLEHPDGAAVLQTRLVEGLNHLVTELCSQIGARSSQVVEAVLVGNTAMHHICALLPVRQLGLSPYVPVIGEALELRASEIGLALSSGARVYLPPNIAGYVGADHVAMLLAMDMGRKDHPTIALDIGTNTEVTLAVPQEKGGVRLLSCSCASGPAFEGAHIRYGMRAAPGAIERVQMIDEQVYIKTIGNSPPVGICGSGILDAIAAMRLSAILDQRGVFQENHPGVRRIDSRLEFVLAPKSINGTNQDITISRQDVNEIQLAKGAIRAGVEILLDVAGLEALSVEEFIVAGAFGTYLDLESAIQIGMFPALPRERYRQVGNAAGAGARQLLVSVASRREAARLARQVEYIELTTHPSFTDAFVKALIFEA